ncbi:MAG: hypothetical protein M1819_000179 [Sarea resinae]|nr:MAG: hypothetical protein M1819_000179 [Sarea resinae]
MSSSAGADAASAMQKQYNLSENQTPGVIGAVITLMIIATGFVGLRAASRSVSAMPLAADDYVMAVALILAYGTGISSILACHYGVGKHIASPSVNLFLMSKVLWAYEMLYNSVVAAIKVSVILFYHRLFPIPRFTITLGCCAFLVISWWIAVMFTTLFQCQPLHYAWDQYRYPNMKGHCIDAEHFFIGNSIASCLTDVIILIVPIPMIWKLQVPRAQKLAISSIFLLGSFVCIASILRIYFLTFLTRSEDLTWNLGQSIIWSCVEPCIGIVSACLPTLRPLLRYAFPRWFNNSRFKGSSGGQRTTRHHGSANSSGGVILTTGKSGRNFTRLQDLGAGLKAAGAKLRPDDEVELTYNISRADSFRGPRGDEEAGFAPGGGFFGEAMGMGITVKQDFHWSESQVDPRSHDETETEEEEEHQHQHDELRK